MLDADEIFEYEDSFALPELNKDCYWMKMRQVDAADCHRAFLINAKKNWRWEGILHEVLKCPEETAHEFVPGVMNYCNTAIGARSKIPMEEKYYKDALILEEALKKEPDNARYVYYLGISYMASKHYDLAAKNFEKRANMPSGDVQETFLSLYNLGQAQEELGKYDEAVETYFKAHNFRPTRAEPLSRAASLYRKKGNILVGYLLTKYALMIPFPQQDSCVEYMAYDYNILTEFANCALLLGKYDEGLDACVKLLANPDLPEDYKGSVAANLQVAHDKISSKVNAEVTK